MFTSYEKKIVGLAILALLFAILSYSLANNAQTTADNNANITNIFEILVNNTDLYANGQRVTGLNYSANDYPIEIAILFHVVGTGASLSVDTNLSINGTMV